MKRVETYKNPLMNLMASSVGKFCVIAATVSVKLDARNPHTMICLRPRVSDRKPHKNADVSMPEVIKITIHNND